jgi:tight adherence protein B
LIAVLTFAFVSALLVALYQRRQALRRPAGDPGEIGFEPAPESFLDRWEREAMQAGLIWKRQVYYGAGAVGAVLAGLFFPTGHPVAAALCVAVGITGPYLYVRRMRTLRAAMFARQLPQALFLGGSVLRGGGTLLNAVDVIAQEMPAPMGTEFQIIQQQMRLQVPAHEAMAKAQARIGVREFAAVVVAARITTEVGGNLAHIFDEIARSIMEAENAQRTVKAFTTEGRMSANLIAALPFVVMGLMQVMSPAYFKPLYTDWTGRAVLAVCVLTIITGWRVILRMVNIRIF